MYNRMIIAFVRMLMLQKKEQIAGFNKYQEVDTATSVFFRSRYKSSLGFLKRGYNFLF